MATAFLPGVVILPARDDSGAAKRPRDDEPLQLSEEADARGWSSSVLERSLALRRRKGAASISSPRGCGWVASAAATTEELGCRHEEAAAVGAGALAEENAVADPCFVAYNSNCNLPKFDPPPMATPLLPLCAFIADLSKARIRNNDRVAKRAHDEEMPMLSEEADACGWSSEVSERNLTPRRRRVPASSSSRRGCGWFVIADDTSPISA